MSRAPSGFCSSRIITLRAKCFRWTGESLYRPRMNADKRRWLERFVRDAVDFHFHLGLVELRFYRGARRARVAEERSVDFVHGGEILRVLQKNGTLHYVRGRGAGLLQDAADVFQ